MDRRFSTAVMDTLDRFILADGVRSRGGVSVSGCQHNHHGILTAIAALLGAKRVERIDPRRVTCRDVAGDGRHSGKNACRRTGDGRKVRER